MSMNVTILSGNVVHDLDLKYVGDKKTPVTKFRIAHNKNYKINGEWQSKGVFVDCEVWGKQAEFAVENLSKGDMTIVKGELDMDTWEDKDGKNRNTLKIKVDSFEKPTKLMRAAVASTATNDDGGMVGDGDDIPF